MNKAKRNNGKHPTLDLSRISNMALPKNVKEMVHDLPSVHAAQPGLTPPWYSRDWEFGLINYRAYNKGCRRTPPGDRTPKASSIRSFKKTPITAIFRPLKTAIFAPKNLTLRATTKSAVAIKQAHQTLTITAPLKAKTKLRLKTRILTKKIERFLHPNDLISPVMPITPPLTMFQPRTPCTPYGVVLAREEARQQELPHYDIQTFEWVGTRYVW